MRPVSRPTGRWCRLPRLSLGSILVGSAGNTFTSSYADHIWRPTVQLGNEQQLERRVTDKPASGPAE
jgi:hypothetical protein